MNKKYKKCSACRQEKNIDFFSPKQSQCKSCRALSRKKVMRAMTIEQRRQWRQKYIKTYQCWYSRNKKRIRARQDRWMRRKPWLVYLYSARHRCNYEGDDSFQRYGGRGIRCHLKAIEIKRIWERDNAHLLNNPSLDRIDSDKNYSLDNCRFIEFKENCRLGGLRKKGKKMMESTKVVHNEI